MGAGPGHLQFSENANRVHLTDLFAQVAGVELIEEDWLRVLPQHTANTNAAVVIHIGASTLQKTLSWHKWMRVIIGLLEQTQVSIVVVGSKDEREFANQAVRVSDEHAARITNRVGETSILELVEIIREAQLLIAGDSAPAQLASLTNTPVLNLSFPIVSAYETAPRSARTRILRVTSDVDLAAEEVVREAVAMLNESTSTNTECERTLVSLGRTAPFSGSTATTDFEWALLQAVYMGQPFPPPSSTLFSHAIQRLHEVNEVAIEQLPAFSKPITQAVAGTANGESQNNASQNNALNALSVAKSILDRVDDIMNQVVRMVPETGVFVRWFQTERLRVGPRSLDELIAVHFQLHDRLREILSVYLETENREAQERVHEDVVV
jgi:hypothetical protein